MVTLRQASPDDAAALSGLVAELGYPAPPDVIARRLSGIAAEPEHVVLVATEGAAVLGYVEVAYERRLTANDEGTVRGLSVTADHRGKGVGTALMAAAETWARERGARRVRVRSQVDRTETHAFYGRRGYTPLKTQHSFRRDF